MPNSKAKILIIDDDKSILKLVQQTLKDCNVLTATAINGKTAIAKAKANHFDLILLDIQLPDINGYEVCEKLKLYPTTMNTPIIFLTVQRDIESLSKGFDAGAVDYITKPFHPQELKRRVELHIHEKRYQEFLINNTRDKEKEKQDIALFISTLGHEIRNPLNSILGFSEILESDAVSDEERKTYAEYINKSGKTLFQLLSDIIDISKIESGKISIQKSDISINKELTELSQLYQNLVNSSGKPIKVTINNSYANKDLIINTDLLRLNQIFRNLLDNAVKYSNGENITFGYDKVTESNIRFFVLDDGQGIDDKLVKKIFNFFERGDLEEITHKDGKGLGLAICRNIVEKLGGEIKLKTKLGKGTKFYFTLPIHLAQNMISEQVKADTLDWSKKTILIVEDVMVNYLFLKASIQKTGAKILHASDGLTAIKLTKESNPDIILMDMVMPGISGIQATMEIRKFKPMLPIIAQTGHDSVEERENILKAGCNAILIKPIKPKNLLEVLSKYLD